MSEVTPLFLVKIMFLFFDADIFAIEFKLELFTQFFKTTVYRISHYQRVCPVISFQGSFVD